MFLDEILFGKTRVNIKIDKRLKLGYYRYFQENANIYTRIFLFPFWRSFPRDVPIFLDAISSLTQSFRSSRRNARTIEWNTDVWSQFAPSDWSFCSYLRNIWRSAILVSRCFDGTNTLGRSISVTICPWNCSSFENVNTQTMTSPIRSRLREGSAGCCIDIIILYWWTIYKSNIF